MTNGKQSSTNNISDVMLIHAPKALEVRQKNRGNIFPRKTGLIGSVDSNWDW